MSLGECSNRLVLSVTVTSVIFALSLTEESHGSHRKSSGKLKTARRTRAMVATVASNAICSM